MITRASVRRPILAAWLTFLVFLGLFFADGALARLERVEIQREASNEYSEGMRLLGAGKAREAAERFQRAYSIERSNRAYLIGYARSLMESARPEEAAELLRLALNRSSNDGESNLLMARIMAKGGKTAEADAFYHRAVYGTWPENGEARVLETRLELAEYLAGHGSSRGLLAELLILQDESANDPALGRKVAGLLLASGSASRSAALYRELLTREPHASDLWDGLGRAELESGDYRNATTAFLRVIRSDPLFDGAARRLRLSSELSRLDPTPRTLGSWEKYRRTVELLKRAVDGLGSCAPDDALLESVREELSRAGKLQRSPSNEDSEAVLKFAAEVWHERVAVCAAPSPDDPLGPLMEKISK